MKYLPTLIALLMGTNIPAQSINLDGTTTRAVVIGISDYQDNNIPDLRFADRDAQAFSDWLKSPAGGNIPEENILLLTNEKATAAAIGLALYELIDDCKAGEQAVIYFSGHGDVETKTIRQNGYLLGWDTPASVYISGAVPLRDLQDVISTLSEGNKANVLVITDACHAGKLAGSGIGGAQATARVLSEQFAKECKILSCQPNEFSIEGEQWGGGRGVFSYFLLKGLTGLADKNSDGSVSLLEISRYVQDAVPAQTEQSQTPFTVGNLQTVLAKVDAHSLESLRKKEELLTASMKTINPKGLEDDVLAKADSATREQYAAFKTAIAAHNLLEPADRNAWDLFQKLSANEQLEPLHRLMRRNLATALLDEVQQALNALLDADPYAYNKWYYEPSRFTQYPEYLQRAMDLLGENHYMRRSLMSKKLYFEALNLNKGITDASLSTEFRDSLKAMVKSKLREAIRYENKAAYLYHAIGNFYLRNSFQHTDSVLQYCSKAIEYSPNWLLPYLDISYEYQLSLNNILKTEEWLNKALEINAESYVVLERLSWLRQWQNKTDESLEISMKMIAMKPDLFNAYGTAGVTCLMRKEFEQAEKYLLQMQVLNPDYNNEFHQLLVNLLIRTRRIKEGISLAEKIIQSDRTELIFKTYAAFQAMLQCYYAGQNLLAEKYASEILKMNAVPAFTGLAYMVESWLKFQDGDIRNARELMFKSIETYIDGAEPKIMEARMEAHISEKEGDLDKADSLFRQAMILPPGFPAHDIRNFLWLEVPRLDYGQFLLRQKRYAEAQQQFQTLLDTEPLGYHGYYGMALLSAAKGKKEEALDFLERSFELYFPSAKPMLAEPLFKKIRKTKRFEALLKKHFPDRFKD